MMKAGKDLRVGDVVRYLWPNPWVAVVAVRKYDGPLVGLVEWSVDTRPGVGFSMGFGDEVEVAVDGPRVKPV